MSVLYSYPELRKLLKEEGLFLMLDRAEVDTDKALAVKNVTQNEQFFLGHFPKHPIMPGVLQLGAMKQLSLLVAKQHLTVNEGEEIFLKAAEKIKFRKPNVPGDRLKIETVLTGCADNCASFKGTITNAAGLACEALLTLGVRPVGRALAMPQMFNEFDKSENTVMDCTKTMELMPHRFPFLLIDHLSSIEGSLIKAVKNVTGNEPFFNGMSNPAVPEFLLCEMGAQSGCASVLSKPENTGKLAIFMSIDKMESFFPILPGDQIVNDCELPPAKGRFGKGNCRMMVDGKVAFTLTMTFAVVEA